MWPEIDVVLYRTFCVRNAKNHLQGHDNQDLNLDSKRVFTLSGTLQFRISWNCIWWSSLSWRSTRHKGFPIQDTKDIIKHRVPCRILLSASQKNSKLLCWAKAQMLDLKCYTEIKNTGHFLFTYTFQLPERRMRPTGLRLEACAWLIHPATCLVSTRSQ